MRIFKRLIRRFLRGRKTILPFDARHIEHSLIVSMDDDPAQPDSYLLDVAIGAVSEARTVSVLDVVSRMKKPPFYPEVWPGEHYKLLAGLVRVVKPQLVIEVGTSTGLSALTILQHLPCKGRITTFDVVPWKGFADTALLEDDFSGGRLQQEVIDISQNNNFDRFRELIHKADLFFVDGPKDGVFEQKFLDYLGNESLPANPLVVFDDIRVWNMLKIWRAVKRPKLDLTSFGHWSGTGLIHWVGM